MTAREAIDADTLAGAPGDDLADLTEQVYRRYLVDGDWRAVETAFGDAVERGSAQEEIYEAVARAHVRWQRWCAQTIALLNSVEESDRTLALALGLTGDDVDEVELARLRVTRFAADAAVPARHRFDAEDALQLTEMWETQDRVPGTAGERRRLETER